MALWTAATALTPGLGEGKRGGRELPIGVRKKAAWGRVEAGRGGVVKAAERGRVALGDGLMGRDEARGVLLAGPVLEPRVPVRLMVPDAKTVGDVGQEWSAASSDWMALDGGSDTSAEMDEWAPRACPSPPPRPRR